MSQNVLERDFFDSAGGPPVPSWDTLGKGGQQGGIILPQFHPITAQVVSYLTTQQTSMAEEGKPSVGLTFDNGDPRPQAEFIVLSEVRDFSDCSERYRHFAKENDMEDDGIRRLIVKGGPGSKSLLKNGRATFGMPGRPPVGAYITYTLVDIKKDPKTSYKTNITEVTFRKPDARSLQIVADYMAANYPEHSFSAGAPDAFAASAAPASSPADEAPGF